MLASAVGERTKRSKEKEAVGVQKGNVNEKGTQKRTLWKEEELILPATRTWRNRFVALFVPSTRLCFLQDHPQNLLLDLQT